jgi:hypothetical protein
MADPLNTLRRLPKSQWPKYLASLDEGTKENIVRTLKQAKEASKWADNPVGYIEDVLGDRLWSRQKEIAVAIRDNSRVAIPSCHSSGKTHLVARIAVWWIMSHPVGTARVLTTATNWRQVKNQLWPHIKTICERNDLPGRRNMTEWFIGEDLVAFGFSSNDPEAIHGEHKTYLLIIVDEAGGIETTIGQAFESLMSSGDPHILLIGNPPFDEENTWFEDCCESKNIWKVIELPAADTPNWTNEDTGKCTSCPATLPEHKISTHLVSRDWAANLAEEYGEDSPMYISKVLAQFPKGAASKAIPFTWVELATNNDQLVTGTAIRLGVDIASDGGDELVIARAVGNRVELVHTSAGAKNSNAVDVTAKVLREIEEAERLNDKYENDTPVVVKIDSTGVGWGVASSLERMKEEGVHNAEIVRFVAGESATDTTKYVNRRAEMWWLGRLLLAPIKDEVDPDKEISIVHLNTDKKSAVQLNAPNYGNDSHARIRIERKIEMKRRGVSSPDRAEAILMALYDPKIKSKRRARLIL